MAMPASDQIRELALPIMARFGVPGMGVAVVSGDESLALGLGVRDSALGAAVDADTTFQLASCSKAYTATAAALAVDAGVLAWDDPVRKHLPEFQMHDERLSSLATLRDLLSMRLGYGAQGVVNWGRNPELGIPVIFERLRHLEVIAGFRELFTYLNPAYTLMAEVIARVSGKTFAQYVRDALSLPLGQTNTFIQEGRLEPTRPHAFPHVDLDGRVEPLGMARCGGKQGESCLYSSPNDAIPWLRLHLGGGEVGGRRLVSRAAMGEMHRSHVYGPAVPELENYFFSYAMGWQRRDTPNGPILLHEGVEFGVATFTILDVLRKSGVAVYANLNSSPAVKAIGYSLIDILAGRTPRGWADLFEKLAADNLKAVQAGYVAQLAKHLQPAPAIGDIVGSYFHPANGIIDIGEASAGLDLRVRDGWAYDAMLEPLGDNLFGGPYRFPGMRALARQGMRLRVFRDEQGLAIQTPGLGIARKVA
ncbi:MAG: beta-lactamase [Phenylobacterium sp.]|nr:beta-lactamase [Phenylobacterium sp.]